MHDGNQLLEPNCCNIPISLIDPTAPMRDWPKWAPDEYPSALREEHEQIKKGMKCMRILPYKDQLVGPKDVLSEGRLAGVLDRAYPLSSKAGIQLSPLNLYMLLWRDYEGHCTQCLPEKVAEITDGVPPDVDKDLVRFMYAHRRGKP